MIPVAANASNVIVTVESSVLWYGLAAIVLAGLLLWGLHRADNERAEREFRKHRGHKHGVIAKRPEKKKRGKTND